MTLHRRRFLHLAATAALPALPQSVAAQGYPSRAITCIVPFPPGAATDVCCRWVVHQWIGSNKDLSFQIDSKKNCRNQSMRVDRNLEDALQLTPILDLKPMLIGRAISSWLRVRKEGVGKNPTPIAPGRFENNIEGRSIRL